MKKKNRLVQLLLILALYLGANVHGNAANPDDSFVLDARAALIELVKQLAELKDAKPYFKGIDLSQIHPKIEAPSPNGKGWIVSWGFQVGETKNVPNPSPRPSNVFVQDVASDEGIVFTIAFAGEGSALSHFWGDGGVRLEHHSELFYHLITQDFNSGLGRKDSPLKKELDDLLTDFKNHPERWP